MGGFSDVGCGGVQLNAEAHGAFCGELLNTAFDDMVISAALSTTSASHSAVETITGLLKAVSAKGTFSFMLTLRARDATYAAAAGCQTCWDFIGQVTRLGMAAADNARMSRYQVPHHGRCPLCWNMLAMR